MLASTEARVQKNTEVLAARIVELSSQVRLLSDGIRLVLPEIKASLRAGDGRFTAQQVQVLEDALQVVEGRTS